MADTTTAGLLAHAEQVCAAVLGSAASAAVSVSVHIAGEDVPGHFPATHVSLEAMRNPRSARVPKSPPRLGSTGLFLFLFPKGMASTLPTA